MLDTVKIETIINCFAKALGWITDLNKSGKCVIDFLRIKLRLIYNGILYKPKTWFRNIFEIISSVLVFKKQTNSLNLYLFIKAPTALSNKNESNHWPGFKLSKGFLKHS